MAASDDLFHLINGLSQGEKKAFSLASSRHVKGEKNNYVKLFSLIDKQTVYDEEKIKATLKRQGLGQHFAVVKNSLYDLLLDSLEQYHSDADTDSRLKGDLSRIRILFEKELYQQCRKIIAKAKPVAAEGQVFLRLIELIEWEITIIRQLSYQGINESEIEELYNEIETANRKYLLAKRIERAANRIYFMIAKKGMCRSEEDMAALQLIFDNPVLQNSQLENELPYHATFHYLTVCSIYYYCRGDHENVCNFSSKLARIMEDFRRPLTERENEYVAVLSMLLASQFHLKKYDDIAETVNRLRQITARTKSTKDNIFITTSEIELNICQEKGEFAKGVILVSRIEDGLKSISLAKIYELNLFYNFACTYFGNGQFREALKWVNRIINDPVGDSRSDILCFARILNLIFHYELGNLEHLNYVIRSTYSFLYKRARLYKVETCILNFIRTRISGISTRKQLLASFVELKSEIEKITLDEFERKALDYFDIISWLQSKIENRSFGEVVKEKFEHAIHLK